jgi:hypothetical protein
MPKSANPAVRIAVAPALFVVALEGFVWLMSAINGWGGWIGLGAIGLFGGALFGIVAVPLILVAEARDRVMWSVVSVCLTVLGLLFGFIFLLQALQVACGGGCFGD